MDKAAFYPQGPARRPTTRALSRVRSKGGLRHTVWYVHPAQKIQNAQELAANRALCPLSDEAICGALGWTPEQLAANLSLSAGSDPAQVWQLRDFLEQAARDLGGQSVAFTIMSEAKRRDAEGWFGRWTVPPTPRR